MNVNMIVDLQYGSTGKGLLAGFLAEKTGPDVLVTCNMPNAGHTYIDSCGRQMMFKVLPNGIVSDNVRYALIGPGAVFDPQRLWDEVQMAKSCDHGGFEVLIHPNATVLQKRHTEAELESMSKVSSTMQGSGAASIHKMMRQPGNTPVVSDNQLSLPFEDRGIRVVDHDEWMHVLDDAELVQAEGCQGFSLGINQRFYPFCTSRECTPHRLMSDMGLPAIRDGLTVYGSLRTFPIRVGNTTDGWSGGNYPDQVELQWADLGVEPELTTVTKRVRRVFTFSNAQLQEALWHCRPDRLFVNFCNYITDELDLRARLQNIDEIAWGFRSEIFYTGHGPSYHDVKYYHP